MRIYDRKTRHVCNCPISFLTSLHYVVEEGMEGTSIFFCTNMMSLIIKRYVFKSCHFWDICACHKITGIPIEWESFDEITGIKIKKGAKFTKQVSLRRQTVSWWTNKRPTVNFVKDKSIVDDIASLQIIGIVFYNHKYMYLPHTHDGIII